MQCFFRMLFKVFLFVLAIFLSLQHVNCPIRVMSSTHVNGYWLILWVPCCLSLVSHSHGVSVLTTSCYLSLVWFVFDACSWCVRLNACSSHTSAMPCTHVSFGVFNCMVFLLRPHSQICVCVCVCVCVRHVSINWLWPCCSFDLFYHYWPWCDRGLHTCVFQCVNQCVQCHYVFHALVVACIDWLIGRICMGCSAAILCFTVVASLMAQQLFFTLWL